MKGLPEADPTPPGAPTAARRYLLPLAAVLLGLVLHGYRYGIVDQDIYLPLVGGASAEARFRADDLLFQANVANYSLFWWGIGRLQESFDLEWLLLASFVAFSFLFLASFANACRSLGLSDAATALALLFACGPLPVGGRYTDPGAASIQTWEIYVTQRTAATALGWVALAAALRRKWVPSLLLAGLLFSVHPVSAAPILAALGGIWLRERAFRNAKGRLGVLAFLLGVVPFLFLRAGQPRATSPFAPVDDEWLAVLHVRNPYAFLLRWSPFAFAVLGLWVATFVACRSPATPPLAPDAARSAKAAVAGVLVLCAFAFAATDLHPVAGAAQVQVFRGLAIPILLGLACVARGLVEALRGPAALRFAAAWTGASLVFFDERLLLAGLLGVLGARLRAGIRLGRGTAVVVAAAAAAFLVAAPRESVLRPLPKRSIALAAAGGLLAALAPRRTGGLASRPAAPFVLASGILLAAGLLPEMARGRWRERFDPPGTPRKDAWEETQVWARENTARPLFVVPPERSGFRTGSGRSVFVTFKDGGAALLDRAFALEWRDRMRALGGLDGSGFRSLGAADFEALARERGVTHAVVERDRKLPFPVAYENDAFRVYRLPADRAPR